MLSRVVRRFGVLATWLLLARLEGVDQPPPDATTDFTVSRANDRSTLDRRTNVVTSTADVTITNSSQKTFVAPVHAVLVVTVANGGAPTLVQSPGSLGGPAAAPYNRYYLDLGPRLTAAQILPGAKVTFPVKFTRLSTVQFSWKVEIHASPPGPPPVNRDPEITSTPGAGAVVDLVYYYQIAAVDPDGDVLTYALTSAPAGVFLDPLRGLLSWQPSLSQLGTHPFSLRVLDGRGGSRDQAFSVLVDPRNRPPQFNSAPKIFATIPAEYRYQASAYDADGDSLAFTWAGAAPAGAVLDAATGLLTWSADASQIGVHTLSLQVSDSRGGTDSQTFRLTVVDGRQPLRILSPSGPQEVVVGQSLVLDVTTTHPGAALGAPILPENARLDGARFRFTPAASQEGVVTAVLSATAGDLSANAAIPITVRRLNSPPVFDPVNRQSVDEGAQLVLPITARDPDGDPVRISAPNLTLRNAVLDALQGQLILTPEFDQAGVYQVVIKASDARSESSLTVTIEIVDRTPPSTGLDLVVDPLPRITLKSRETVTGSVKGQSGPPRVQKLAYIAGLSPASLLQGRSGEVMLTGVNTEWTPNGCTADFGDGITVDSFSVLSPTSARAMISVASNANVGPRTVRLCQVDGETYSVVAFDVSPGAATLRGRILDSFTGQPLAGVRIRVTGTALSVVTDANGSFALEGAPVGPQELIVTGDNYEAVRVNVVVGASETIDLAENLQLRALARPASPGGTIPREASLASVIDRGISSQDFDLTLEQARDAIQDTLVVVGGTQMGVLDASGQQLNPQLEGSHGALSVTQAGLDLQARALIEGDLTSLGDAIRTLRLAYLWAGELIDVQKAVGLLQMAADEAWANPADPSAAATIVLLNEGRSLSSRAPIVTPETRLNRFQVFLLYTSFLVHHQARLEAVLDDIYRRNGIDPDTLVGSTHGRRPARSSGEPKLAVLPGGMLSVLAYGALGQTTQGSVLASPNFDPRDRSGVDAWLKRSTYESAATNAFQAGIQAAIFTAAISSAVVVMGGGSLPAAVAGIGIAALEAALVGFAVEFILKLGQLYLAEETAASVTPDAPLIESVRHDLKQHKVFIEFNISTAQVNAEARADKSKDPLFSATRISEGLAIDPAEFSYAYHLWKFKGPIDTNLSDGFLLAGAKPILLRRDGKLLKDKLQFVIDDDILDEGFNYFRVVTVQYYRLSQLPPEKLDLKYTYRDMGADVPNDFPLYYDSPMDLGKALTNPATLAPIIASQKRKIAELEAEARRLTQGLKSRDANVIGATMEKQAVERELIRLEKEIAAHRRPLEDFVEALEQEARVTRTLENGLGLVSSLDDTYKQLDTLSGPLVGRLAEDVGAPTLQSLPDATRARLIQYAKVSADTKILAEADSIDVKVKENLQGWLERLDRTSEVVRSSGQAQVVKIRVNRPPPPEVPSGIGTAPVRRGMPWISELSVDLTVGPDTDLTLIKSRLNALIDEQDARIKQNSLHLDRYKSVRGDARLSLQDQLSGELPAREAYRARGAELHAQHQETVENLRKKRNVVADLEQQKLAVDADLADSRKSLGSFEAEVSPEPSKAKVRKGVKAFAEVGGAIMDFQEGIEMVRDGVSVLTSKMGDCIIIPRGLPGNAPVSNFEADPRLGGYLMTLTPRPDPLNPKGGFLDQESLLATFDPIRTEAGFPSSLIAVDRAGRIYLNNANSNLTYGGRIFRYGPAPGTPPGEVSSLYREHIGSITYYSIQIQFGRPAFPAAMEIGDFLDPATGAVAEDLFVANIDGPYIDAGREQKARILRVPTHFADTVPAFANGQNRNRIVGQEYAEHPDFKFTGPSDMEVDVVETGLVAPRPMYVSDEENIFVVRQQGDGSVRVDKIARVPGRRWSGLAQDTNGGLFFADYAAGELFYLDFPDLVSILNGTAPPLGSEEELNTRSYLLKPGLVRPGDVELDTLERRCLVAAGGRLTAFDLSLIGRYGEGILEMHVKIAGKEQPITLRPGRGRVFIVGVESAEEFGQRAYISVKRRDAGGRTYWERRTVQLRLSGVTVLREAL